MHFGTVSPLTLRLFGAFETWVGEMPLPHMRTKKERWLLALLALQPNRPIRRAWLAQTLWPFPETLESQAANNLRRSLSELRKALGTEASRLSTPTPETVTLDLTGADCDVSHFDAFLRSGDTRQVEQAILLYRGALLAECTEWWVLPEREARQQSYRQALRSLYQGALDSREYPQAVRWLRQAVAAEPLWEEAQRDLMAVLTQMGDLSAALLVYQEYSRLLRREDTALIPSAEMQALYRTLRDETRNRARNALPAPVSTANGAPKTAARRLLPRPVTELIGRRQETLEIEALLRTHRLVSLLGMGGIGKTRLALAVSEKLLPHFEDGVCFIELAHITDPLQVPQAVALALKVREESDHPIMETLVQAMHFKSILLVLDNCEHVIRACAELASHLLREGAGVHILTTSRQALHVTGEIAWPVPSLLLPETEELDLPPETLVSRLSQYDSVRLFVERAQAAQSTFRITKGNAQATAQLCRRLDGIPLALELAAVRVKSLSVEQITERLDNRFGLLRGGDTAALPRQKTLQALFDWSYDLLNARERDLLWRLTVFVGAWTLEAAEQTCVSAEIEEWEILDLLTALVDQSLILAELEGSQSRFRMLESVRVYGIAKRPSDVEMHEIRRRHLDYYLEVATSEPNLRPEYGNLHAALEFSLGSPDIAPEDRCKGLRLIRLLLWFWIGGGHYEEGGTWAARGVRYLEVAEPALQAQVLYSAGVLQAHHGDTTQGAASLEQSVRLFRASDDLVGLGEALMQLGHFRKVQGDSLQARLLLEESVVVLRDADAWVPLGWAHSILAGIAGMEGDLQEAGRQEQAAVQLFRETNTLDGITSALSGIGEIALAEGKVSTARYYLEESANIAREHDFKNFLPWVLVSLSITYMEMGDLGSAQTLLIECLDILRTQGILSNLASILSAYGRLAFLKGHWKRAARLYGAATGLQTTNQMSPHETARSRREQSEASAALGESDYAALFVIGQTMTADRAIAYALSDNL